MPVGSEVQAGLIEVAIDDSNGNVSFAAIF